MSDALVPIEQKTVVFYEDEITAVVVDADGKQEVYVPLRPICDYLGIDWGSQFRRVGRDKVLSKASRSVVVMTTDRGPREMACLPLDMLNGWLFGINASRVREDLQERVIRYQEECYRVLAQAFQSPATRPEASTTLMQVYEMGKAIMQMAQEQMEFDRRLSVQEGRMEQAAVVVGDLRKRVSSLEQQLRPGAAVTNEQASQISEAVKAVALAAGKQSGKNEFAAVYSELYRRYGVTSYKLLPARKFNEVMKWLTEWYQSLTDEEVPF